MIEVRPSGETLVTRASAAFAAYQQGDRSAFDSLVEILTPLLWHTVRSQGVDRVAAEDVLQTVWLNLLNSSDSVRDPHTIVKWLLTSTRRESWRVTQKDRAQSTATVSVTGDDDGLADLPAPAETAPDQVLLGVQRQQQLWEHVTRLAPRCQQLLRVIAFADRPDYAMIARSMGIPVGSIGPTRGRCLAKLRAQLDRDPGWQTSVEA